MGAGRNLRERAPQQEPKQEVLFEWFDMSAECKSGVACIYAPPDASGIYIINDDKELEAWSGDGSSLRKKVPLSKVTSFLPSSLGNPFCLFVMPGRGIILNHLPSGRAVILNEVTLELMGEVAGQFDFSMAQQLTASHFLCREAGNPITIFSWEAEQTHIKRGAFLPQSVAGSDEHIVRLSTGHIALAEKKIINKQINVNLLSENESRTLLVHVPEHASHFSLKALPLGRLGIVFTSFSKVSTIQIWDTQSIKLLRAFQDSHRMLGASLMASPHSSVMVGMMAQTDHLFLFDSTIGGAGSWRLPGHVNHVSFLPQGQLLLCTTAGRRVAAFHAQPKISNYRDKIITDTLVSMPIPLIQIITGYLPAQQIIKKLYGCKTTIFPSHSDPVSLQKSTATAAVRRARL